MEPVCVLTVAGSDSCAGAGVEADLKTAMALGAYGTVAITSVTAQNTLGVVSREDLAPTRVSEQIRAVLEDLDVAAIKVGMLGSAETVRTVAEELADFPGPMVVDPVAVATSGDPLLDEEAVGVLRTELAPLATVVTPNRRELEFIWGVDAGTSAQQLALQLEPCPYSLLVTGGDAAGDEVVDILFDAGRFREWRGPRIGTQPVHGTGCSLSTALAVHLGLGQSLEEAATASIEQVRRWVGRSLALGRGAALLPHGLT